MTDFIPPIVAHYIEDLTRRGLPHEVKYMPGKIKLTSRNDRVVASAEFRRRSDGWYNDKPMLRIDGVQCEIAHSFDELKHIMDHPDLHKSVQVARSQFPNGFDYCQAPAVGEPVDPDGASVPAKVILHYQRAKAILPKIESMTPTVQLERPRPGIWQIRIFDPNTEVSFATPQFVVVMIPDHKSWKISYIALIILPGEDSLALDLGSDLDKALAHADKLPEPSGSGPAARTAQAPRGKNDQLAVKRHTVIRN